MIVKDLSYNFLDRLLFHAEVVYLAIRENDPANLGDFISRDLQLNRSIGAFDDFP